jgi:hypothetical protein
VVGHSLAIEEEEGDHATANRPLLILFCLVLLGRRGATTGR